MIFLSETIQDWCKNWCFYTKSVFFCQNNAKSEKKVLISYQISILLPKQCEIGKKSTDFLPNQYSFAKTIRNRGKKIADTKKRKANWLVYFSLFGRWDFKTHWLKHHAVQETWNLPQRHDDRFDETPPHSSHTNQQFFHIHHLRSCLKQSDYLY